MLTPEQITRLRTEAGIPQQGIGTAPQPPEQRIENIRTQSRLNIFNEVRNFMEPSPEGVRVRDVAREFMPEAAKAALNLIPFSTLPAKQPLTASKETLGFEALGVLPFAAFAKPLKPIIKSAKPIFEGFKDLTTKFLEYAKGKTTLSKQEIMDFARRPELKKGEADLLLKRLEEFEPSSNPLAQEARKYKSAEDYIASQSKFVHESNVPVSKFDLGKVGQGQGENWYGNGAYLQEAGGFKLESYGKVKNEFYLPKDAKVFDGNIIDYAKSKGLSVGRGGTPKDVFDANWFAGDKGMTNKVAESLKKDGFDAFNNDGELVVYKPEILKTKQQLVDTFYQSKLGNTIPKELQPLAEHAKLFKSADEFLKSEKFKPDEFGNFCIDL